MVIKDLEKVREIRVWEKNEKWESRTFWPRMVEHLSWQGRDPREHGVPEQLDVPSYATLVNWQWSPGGLTDYNSVTQNTMTDYEYPMGGEGWQGPIGDIPVASPLHVSYVKTRRQEGGMASFRSHPELAAEFSNALTLRRTFHSPQPRLSKLRPMATPVCVWPMSLKGILHF